MPNKFPALKIEGNLNKRGDGIYDKMDGVGAHEVIIECPHHHISMAELSEDNIREVLWVYRDRLVDLKKDPRLVHGMLFKNVGAAAGRQPGAHAQPADRHADRADLGLGGDDRVAGVLQLPRPLHLLRHDPAGAGDREARSCSTRPTSPPSAPTPAGSRSRPGSCPRPTPATSRTSPSTGSTTSARVLKPGPQQAGDGARQPAVQLHHPHRAVRPPGAAALPLAHRDHPPADARSPASSGARASTSTRSPPRTPRPSSARSRSARPPMPDRLGDRSRRECRTSQAVRASRR